MKTKLLNLWYSLYSNFWFAPLVLSCLALGLYFGMIQLDRTLKEEFLRQLGWAYSGGADGARAVLSAIAGSMITVAGVVFSITIVVLQLASSQFGPRLIREFMRDRGNQLVLGTFVATFIYCVLVLRSVRGGTDASFVPGISVTVGVLLSLVSLGVLIYFIHHIARSIQVDNVIAAVAGDLHHTIDRLIPSEPPEAAQVAASSEPFAAGAAAIESVADGYLQAIDFDSLVGLCGERNLLVQISRRPGEFVFPGGLLAKVWPEAEVDDATAEAIRGTFILGGQRTPTQDLDFIISQLVEIAVRALSPGINDPTTAMQCIDRLGAGLCRIGTRPPPSAYRFDEGHQLRVVAPVESFGHAVGNSLDQIREHSRGNVAVTLHLLHTLAVIARSARRGEDRAALRAQAEKILRGARESLPIEDREQMEAEYRQVIEQTDEDTPESQTATG